MKQPDLARRLAAEALGTAFLLAAVVGSGIMGEALASGNVAVALLANTLATGAALVVLITIFAPISGAHFNPVVTLVLLLRRELSPRDAALYIGVQIAAAVSGVYLAHIMFDQPVFQLSTKLRSGTGQLVSEYVATFGLIATILSATRFRPLMTPTLVGLYIASAYWFTASTSFANPAVTLARALSNSFAGIAPISVLGFIVAEIAGALSAALVFKWLLRSDRLSTGLGNADQLRIGS